MKFIELTNSGGRQVIPADFPSRFGQTWYRFRQQELGMNSIGVDDRGLVLECPNCSQRNRLAYERLDETFHCGKCHGELHGPSAPVVLNTESEFAALTSKSSLPVLVDFWAPWCGPCKMVAPELVKVAAEGIGRWIIAKVNTETLPTLAQQYQISAIPTFVLFAGGGEVTRQSGAMSAAQIRSLLEEVHSTAHG